MLNIKIKISVKNYQTNNIVQLLYKNDYQRLINFRVYNIFYYSDTHTYTNI